MRVYRVPDVRESGLWLQELSFSPDSRRLALMERYGHAFRWLDLSSGEVIRGFTFRQMNAVTLSPDHSLLGVARLDAIQSGHSATVIERYELPNPNPAFA